MQPGEPGLVPGKSFEFTHEKHMDACDLVFYKMATLQDRGCLSASYFVYMLLCYQGAFTNPFPLATAAAGDIHAVRPECKGWCLIPTTMGDDW